MPFPRSIRDRLDEWDKQRLRVSLHQQLLTGVVIHIDPEEVIKARLDSLDCTAVRKKIALSASGQYWHSSLDITSVQAKDNASLVAKAFEELWELQRTSRIMRLYYRFPYTFDNTKRYYPSGIPRFVAYLQGNKCPCGDSSCDLTNECYDMDHIIPLASRGTNVLINLQASCAPYNRERKRQRPEPRPIDYAAIINSGDWKQRLSADHRDVLLRQTCGPNDLTEVRGLFLRHRTVIH